MKKEKCETYIKIYLGGTNCAFVDNSKFVKVGVRRFLIVA